MKKFVLNGGGSVMDFSKMFNFPSPSMEEIQTVKELAESCPELLDGRELWILKEFVGAIE